MVLFDGQRGVQFNGDAGTEIQVTANGVMPRTLLALCIVQWCYYLMVVVCSMVLSVAVVTHQAAVIVGKMEGSMDRGQWCVARGDQ